MHNFKRGDHLVSPRRGYSHHGLYLGNNRVIHYAGATSSGGSGDIEVCSLDNFCDGHTCTYRKHLRRKFDRETSVHRAFGRLGERRYSVLFNNCEGFVHWCIHGESSSQQVRTGAALAIGAVGAILNGNPGQFAGHLLESAAQGSGQSSRNESGELPALLAGVGLISVIGALIIGLVDS